MRRTQTFVSKEFRRLSLLAGCSERELGRVSAASTVVDLAPGRLLTRQGKGCHQFVMILSGSALVWRDGACIGALGAGDHLGEFTVVRHVAEPATISTETGMTVAVVAEREYACLASDVEPLRLAVDRELDRRIRTWISSASSLLIRDAVPAVVGS
jgi:CRP/FNR family cyclic AMP-dependent transcriptional regulator